jgi:diadenosine tetraphosphate (Ap4A) HIT family hydrolase
MTTRQCIFCTMIRDSIHEAPIYRDDRVIVVRDINPKAPVHLLIIPNMHLASLPTWAPARCPSWGTCSWWRKRWPDGKA